jgi:hypothetical protein
MSETNFRWADVESTTSEEPEEFDTFEEIVPGSGHHYMKPFSIGDITVNTYGDFMYHMDEIYSLFMADQPQESGDLWWAELAAGLCNLSNPDDMDAASAEMRFAISASSTLPPVLQEVSVAPVSSMPTEEMLVGAISAEHSIMMAEMVEELTLDHFERTPPKTGFEFGEAQAFNEPILASRSRTAGPPLCPVVPEAEPISLILSPLTPQRSDVVDTRIDWRDRLKACDPDFPSQELDAGFDMQSAMSSRSNIRPSSQRVVFIGYRDGTRINVGSHGYNISEEQVLELDTSNVLLALQELFAAPGGEGMTCPTPSHILHQMISAVLASMLVAYKPVSEEHNIDLKLLSVPGSFMHDVNFDITTSAGIWNKVLAPDARNPNFVYQAAISKYDMAAVLLGFAKGNIFNLIYRAVANSLACEYPASYRVEYDDVDDDLKLQSAIYGRLSELSHRKIRELGEMCYHAAVRESVTLGKEVDIHTQGTPWKVKRDKLLAKVKGLSPRKDIAVPPLPLGDITPLPNTAFSFDILGNEFCAGDPIFQGRSQGAHTDIDDNDYFLRHFPAYGIVPEEAAREICRILDTTPLKVKGLTHKGPAREYDGVDAVCGRAANEAYSVSAGAQLAEVRADLARLVYKSPMPKPGVWASAYIYMGKVAVWYRCRDDPSSAEGYRIDWFAVSSFPVMGSIDIKTNQGHTLQLWPRQRIRSQELKLAHLGPRRLKLVLFSMVEKVRASRATLDQVYLAWERLILTLNSSTWASGTMFLTCRYLSTSLSSPASPFDEMSKKLEQPKTFADLFYLTRLEEILSTWAQRDQFIGHCPLIGLPRSFSQLESYWMLWVPSDYADTARNMALCVMSLYDEASFLKETEKARIADLRSQYDLLAKGDIYITDLQQSLAATCSINTDGKLGWSWVGSLAAGHALQQRSDPGQFDRRYARGVSARNITDHLTVRHSARINQMNYIEKGTVAEMMLAQGMDDFLSTVDQTYRFIFVNRPTFFNHPKKGEHKAREISITDPDSRQCLSDAELICGMYGKTTGVDFLKDSSKNAKFYRDSARLMTRGGGIQSSDATRYGPSMSNFAIAIMLMYLGSYSMHLKWSSYVYARLAYRRMLLPLNIEHYLSKLMAHDDTKDRAGKTYAWLKSMTVFAHEEGDPYVTYTTSHHMGQGMSHHSSSLLHAGGILVGVDSALQANIMVNDVPMAFKVTTMVTSDDSTLLVEPYPADSGDVANRAMRQIAARIFLQLVRETRKVSLRMVSVVPNLVKEIISAVKGEFNSQDTGIGATCPILGYREAISLLVVPSSPSLVGDYLNAHACSKDAALAGQGIPSGCYMHSLMIDAIEERWGLTEHHKNLLGGLTVLPRAILSGCTDADLLSSPASMLDPITRASLLSESIEVNAQNEDLDPSTKDSVYAPLMHVKVAMSRQHRSAIASLKARVLKLKEIGYVHQAELLAQSLRSTVSSAKTRNLGRVALRVAGRESIPRKYRDIVFEKNTMLEQTMNWLDYMNTEIVSRRPSASDIDLGNSVAGYIRIASTQRTNFPKPPRIRRHYPHYAVKPKYMCNDYGRTPFGSHALARSGTSVVPAIGISEREEMQRYIAMVRHRKFSEHIEYGGAFVISWSQMSTGRIVALDISLSWEMQMKEHIRRGDFSDEGINALKALQDATDRPVLALQIYDGVRGLWHCIHAGKAYTVSMSLDIENTHTNGISHQMETGEWVILALQGFRSNPVWQDTVPAAQEVRNYQMGDYFTKMPDVLRGVETENITSGAATGVTYATELNVLGVKSLIYCAPEVRSTPYENPALLPYVPFLRGKVIASLASAGYWHTALRGVAFRAYLKGAWCQETIWPGGVLGWRQSSTSVPVYHTPTRPVTNVRALFVLGGYNDVDQVSPFNPEFTASGYKAVCESNTLTYSRAYKVRGHLIPLIIQCNSGRRFHIGTSQNTFLDLMPPPIRHVPSQVGAEEARRALSSIVASDDDFTEFF